VVVVDDGVSKYVTFIPVRAGSWTCIVYATHNYVTNKFTINDVAPGKNGEVPDWKSLDGVEFNCKRDIRDTVKQLLLKARDNIEEGYMAITVIVPRKKILEVHKYIHNLEA
jgi:hypothetical protein